MYIINCPYDYFSLLVALELSCLAGEHRVKAGLPNDLDLVIFLKKKKFKKNHKNKHILKKKKDCICFCFTARDKYSKYRRSDVKATSERNLLSM